MRAGVTPTRRRTEDEIRKEAVLGHRAIFDIIDRGVGYAIDIDRIQASLLRCRISFSGDYLYRIIRKYYEQNDPIAT